MTQSPATGAESPSRPVPDGQRQASAATLALVPVKLSDVGRARPHNEDYVDYHIPADPRTLAKRGSIFLVADGMGGHRAGEIASQGAVEMVIAQYYGDTTPDVPTSLVRSFRTANQQLHAQAQSDPSKSGMGTTLVAAVILGRKVYVANVGDSRAYLIGQKGIVQITEDHSWVGEQFRAGLLTEEQARHHPQRNLVTRALASKPGVDVDLFEGEIGPGDCLLLCTDGLTGRLEDAEIAEVVQGHPPAEAARRLVVQANERGGKDNITVLIVSAEEAAPSGAIAGLAVPRRPGSWVSVLVLVGLILLALAVGAYLRAQWWLAPAPTPTSSVASVPAAAATAPPKETVSPETATDTGLPQPTSTPAQQPAGTAALPTDTPLAPTGTITAPVATTAVEITVPPPTLVEPREGDSLRGTVTFTWDYSLERLGPGHAFQVLIWGGDPREANPPGAAGATRALSQQIDLDTILPPQGGPGQYFWTVIVVDERSGDRVSRQAAPRTFIYLGPRGTAIPSSAEESLGAAYDPQSQQPGDHGPASAAQSQQLDPYCPYGAQTWN